MNDARSKSRRQFLQDIVIGGAAFALSGTLRAANDRTVPLTAIPMPQPHASIYRVAFSPVTGRMAVSAGPDDELTSLYVNSPGAPENFKVYWSPDTEVHGVGSMAWSPNEDALAFIGMSGSRTTKTGEVWLYTLGLASGEIRKVLKIGGVDQGKERRLVNVHEDRAVLAWFGNNKVCMPTRDESIIAVDCADGHIETLVPTQDCKIRGLAAVSSSKLRFLRMRPSGGGYELEPCEFDGSKVISNGIIPITADAISPISRLSADGGYVFVAVKEKPTSIIYDKTIIFDLSQMASVKEIPANAESGSERYSYAPVTVLQGKRLVVLRIMLDFDKNSLQGRLVSTKL